MAREDAAPLKARPQEDAYTREGGMVLLPDGHWPDLAAATALYLPGDGVSAEAMLRLHQHLHVHALAALALPLDDLPLSEALASVASLIADLLAGWGGCDPLASNQIVLVGVGRGAAIACAQALGHPRRYGGILAFNPSSLDTTPPATVTGSLDGTPVWLASDETCPEPAALAVALAERHAVVQPPPLASPARLAAAFDLSSSDASALDPFRQAISDWLFTTLPREWPHSR